MVARRNRSFTRRFLRLAAWLVGACVALIVVGVVVLYVSFYSSERGTLSGSNELLIPPLAESTVEEGVRVFELEAGEGPTTFADLGTSITWGYNGSYLGPTLRASRGEQVRVDVSNALDEPTTVHWHGMHLPAEMDGGPHQEIFPGESWSPTWTVDQPAATLWYHPHAMGTTAHHVYRGLAGMFIIDDEEASELGLPDTYGIDDVPLVIQDRDFDVAGRMVLTGGMFDPIGFLGPTILVNGTLDPHWTPSTDRVRFRLLNGSNSRTYDLGFDDEREFWLIATDSGLLEAPAMTQRVQLSPGERVEIIAEFEAGETVVLDSTPPDLGANPLVERLSGGHDSFDILTLRANARLEEREGPPNRLSRHDPTSEPTRTRIFELDDFRLINGRPMDMSRIDEVVLAGTTEVWDVRNPSSTPHNFHIHDIRFKVIAIDGSAPPEALSGWKDTVAVSPGATVQVAITFGHYTDPHHPYMFHCHLLAHEDAGMMGQFVVVSSDEIGQVGTQHEAGH